MRLAAERSGRPDEAIDAATPEELQDAVLSVMERPAPAPVQPPLPRQPDDPLAEQPSASTRLRARS